MANFIPQYISDKKVTPSQACRYGKWLLPVVAILIAAQSGNAAIVDGVTNLIVNGNAEAGSAGTPTTMAASVPGWARTGSASVLAYGLPGYVLLSDPAPPDHGFQYFYSGPPGSGPARSRKRLTSLPVHP